MLLLALSPAAAAAADDDAGGRGGSAWSFNNSIDTVDVRASLESAGSEAGAKASSWPCAPSKRDGGAVLESSSSPSIDPGVVVLLPGAAAAAAAAAADLSSAARDSASSVESAAWPRASNRRPRCWEDSWSGRDTRRMFVIRFDISLACLLCRPSGLRAGMSGMYPQVSLSKEERIDSEQQ